MNAPLCQPAEPALAVRTAQETEPGAPPSERGEARTLTILEATYAQDYRTIASYLLRRTGDHDLAQELASETFAEALRSLDRWNPQGLPLRAWLFRIATRRLAHHRRRQGRAARLMTRWLGGRAPNRTHFADPCADASSVRAAIARLRPPLQDVLVLHHVEGMSVPEIALTLGVAEGTVKSRLFRARSALHAHLCELGVQP